jgi:glycine hydroxymethyltransferase
MAQGIELIAKGTDTHLLLVDLRMHALSGRQAEALLEEVHITCNKNGIPQDPRSAVHTSGLRLGTPAITTRGLEEHHMEIIATCITQRLHDPENSSLTQSIRDQVLALCKAHPLPYN